MAATALTCAEALAGREGNPSACTWLLHSEGNQDFAAACQASAMTEPSDSPEVELAR
jgi:hypothetical protein